MREDLTRKRLWDYNASTMVRRGAAIEPEEKAEARRTAGRPARLSRERAIDAAVAIVREGGMEALTMRALADALDATPMALYRHVGDRDELALLVVDRVMSRVELPDRSVSARAFLRALAREVRDVGRAHRGVMDILLEEGPAVTSTLVILDAVVRKLHEEGATWKEASALHNTFFSWLAATIRREERWAARGREKRPMLRRFMEAAGAMSPSEYPGIAHVLPHMPGEDVDQEFESSLSFMLDGIAVRLGKGGRKR